MCDEGVAMPDAMRLEELLAEAPVPAPSPAFRFDVIFHSEAGRSKGGLSVNEDEVGTDTLKTAVADASAAGGRSERGDGDEGVEEMLHKRGEWRRYGYGYDDSVILFGIYLVGSANLFSSPGHVETESDCSDQQ
jgi:hypothetical protein